ncbi:response regulator [Xanthocytophaga agilis]|uniref:Response regulator n=1 Tax=Xanthocytophaga agilis TaxID=3048010 RepID=A0AAE3R5F6_9BACT|nr:response regulator [Xanthocytophaga agilis]MDJ1501729.1 response regulator [Xanthocytophaga agilis]
MLPILIVDDDKDDQLLLATAFKENRIPNQLKFFNDGMELINYIDPLKLEHNKLPAFILLDLNMPRLNGLQVLKHMKEDILLRSIPIVILSTSQSISQIRECYKLGANCYIVKPDSFDSLMDISAQLYRFWTTVVTLPNKSRN